VVLDVRGHPLVLRVERRAARHRPRDEDAIDFQPEIPVHARGRVLLDDERQVLSATARAPPRGSAVREKSRFCL